MGIEIGQLAPEFTLKNQNGENVQLAHFRGKRHVAVVFFPFAFSGICTGELCELRDNLAAFDADGVQVLGISCDPMYSLHAFAEAEKYSFPLLSDFWPHGEVARSYGVFDQDGGLAVRGTFLIDTAGVLRWQVVNTPGQARSLAAYREAIAAL